MGILLTICLEKSKKILKLDYDYKNDDNIQYLDTVLNLQSLSDEVAEWLRRWTANPMGSARVGSNPIFVEIFFLLAIDFVLNLQVSIIHVQSNFKLVLYIHIK